MRTFRAIAWVCLTCLAMPSDLRADLIYRFEQPNYSVSAGQSVEVKLFLDQTGVTNTLTSEGLFSVGAKVQWTPCVSMQDLSSIRPNPQFDDPFSLVMELTSDMAGLSESADPMGPNFPVSQSSILVGTFTFQADAVNASVQLRASDFTSFTETVTSTARELDSSIREGTAVIHVGASQIPAVPEPSTLLLLSVGLAGAWQYVRLRRGTMAM